jgi:hypothetical protein
MKDRQSNDQKKMTNKYLSIPKGLSEAISRKLTDNALPKRIKKNQTLVGKILHRKLKIEATQTH